MIPASGAALLGLDEFMLRLGHLTVICEAAIENGGYIHRVERAASERLLQLVPIPATEVPIVATYLSQKHLCRIDHLPQDEEAIAKLRYSHLNIASSDGVSKIISDDPSLPPAVWWQDYCLASEAVTSKVGAITAVGRSGSKTGLSHVVDWAALLGLLGKTGEASSEGRVITWLVSVLQKNRNPYALGVERVVYAYLFFRSDFDVSARLLGRLARHGGMIGKREATECFIETLTELSDEAVGSGSLNSRAQQTLIQAWRDVAKGTRGGGKGGSASTAWHRVSSRLETYTDLGLLTKGKAEPSECYEYKYYATSRLAHAVETLASAKDPMDWIEGSLMSVLTSSRATSVKIDTAEFLSRLPKLVESLGSPIGPLPIDSAALSLAATRWFEETPISLAYARSCIVSASHDAPDLIRLARGVVGDRAEFFSVNVRKLGGAS